MLTCCVTLCETQNQSEPHFHCLNNGAEILPISQVGQRASRGKGDVVAPAALPFAELTSLGHLAGHNVHFGLGISSLFSEGSTQPGKSLRQAPSLPSSPTSLGPEALIDAWLDRSFPDFHVLSGPRQAPSLL